MTQEEKNKIVEAAQARRRELSLVMDAVIATEPGKKLFQFLFNFCGYNQAGVVHNNRTGKLEDSDVLHDAVLRKPYTVLRSLVTDRQALAQAEMAAEAPAAQTQNSEEK